MKLWLITQTDTSGYDTYDSAIIAADTHEEARKTHPTGIDGPWSYAQDWARSPCSVKAELIGEAAPNIQRGVVVASFNAG